MSFLEVVNCLRQNKNSFCFCFWWDADKFSRNRRKCPDTSLSTSKTNKLSFILYSFILFKWWSNVYSAPTDMFLICRTEALLEYHHDDDRHHLDSFHLLGCCSSHGMGRLWLWAYEDLLHTGLHQRGQVDLHRCRNDAKTGMLTGPISFRFSAYKNF